MKLLFIGDFSKNSNNNFQFKELKKNYRVEKFDYREEYFKNRFFLNKKISRYLFLLKYFSKRIFYFEFRKKKILNKLVQKIKTDKFDLVIISKMELIDYKIIDEINKFSKTYFYYMDPSKNFFFESTIEYVKRCNFASATFSDVVEKFKKFNKNSFQIVQGINMESSLISKQKDIDVIFVGTIDKKREEIINYLKYNNIKIVTYGKGAQNPPIYSKEKFLKYSKSRIILNFIREGDGFSIRIFEAMVNGFTISEECNDIRNFFNMDKEIVCFKTKEELLEKIRYYLKNNKERNQIYKNGKNKVLKNFTWEKQIEKIEKLVIKNV